VASRVACFASLTHYGCPSVSPLLLPNPIPISSTNTSRLVPQPCSHLYTLSRIPMPPRFSRTISPLLLGHRHWSCARRRSDYVDQPTVLCSWVSSLPSPVSSLLPLSLLKEMQEIKIKEEENEGEERRVFFPLVLCSYLLIFPLVHSYPRPLIANPVSLNSNLIPPYPFFFTGTKSSSLKWTLTSSGRSCR